MTSKTTFFSILFILIISSNEALRLLVFFPLYSKSHGILGQGMVSRLLEAGHEVVHITSFPRDKPVTNLTEISVEALGKRMKEEVEKHGALKLKNFVGKSNIAESFFFIFFTYDVHKRLLEEPQLIKLLSDPKQKFDAVILEWFFANEIAGIAPLFECPLIWFGSTEVHWQLLQLVDEIPNPSYNVDLFSTSTPPLAFWERVGELYTMIKKMVIYSVLVTPFEKSVYNNVFPKIAAERGVTIPSYDEAVYNGSMLLLNSHPSMGSPFRLPQNAKYVAGYHIDKQVPPMPKMGSKTTFFSILFILMVSSNEALRFLVFFPLNSKSHSILGHGLVNRLLEAGHEVVFMTPYPRNKPVSNLTEISLEVLSNEMNKEAEKHGTFSLKNVIQNSEKPESMGELLFFINAVYDTYKGVFDEPGIIKFLSDANEKFDAVILEWFYMNVIAGIAPLFECPLIWFGTTEAHWRVLELVDDIPNPSYNVDLFSTSIPPLTFCERVEELYRMIKKMLLFGFLLTPYEKSIFHNIISKIAVERGVTIPCYDEAVYNGSLLLLNSHPSIGTPYRLPQNAKYIAGYHIDNQVAPLPKDLKNIMDGAKHGVIYFSMGSTLRSVGMSDHMKNSLLVMFGKLKQTVIWKFEGVLDSVPLNVHLVEWAPQHSILSHPNLKIFITHGGQLSTIESVHFGTPVIGIPVMGDQHINMRAVTSRGFGISVKLAEDMADDLLNAIKEMLENTSYRKKAKELSYIYHNRLRSPGDELVFWIEHVVQTRGAPHLRSPALSIPLYKRMYLDLLFLIMSVVYLLFRSMKLLVCKTCDSNEKAKKNRTKKIN